jgi:methyl-accepting chemotaxis protein
VRTRLFGAFGLVLAILILLSSAAYRTTSLNQEATASVIRTFEVINTANGLLTSLVDMETAYRGFLIAGDDVFLEPYFRGSESFDDQIAELQNVTADNPAQTTRWSSIQAQVDAWRQQVTEPGIALRRNVGAGTAPNSDLVAWVASGEGRRRFTAIRQTFNEALSVEEQLLARRQEEATAASERLQIVLVVGTLAAAGIAVILALVLTADIVTPITRLATTAHEIAAGRLDRRIGLTRGDEIGVAAAAFDSMAERI